MLSEYPNVWMPMNVISTLVGIEIAVTRVARTDSRNSRMTSTAKSRPSMPSWASDSIDCWMYGAWSKTTMNSEPEPIESCRSGSAAVTARDTSTVLAEGSFVTAIVRAGSPFTREIEVTGSCSCATVATSAIVTAPACACAGVEGTRGSAAMSSDDVSFAPVCTVRVWSFSVTVPPGKSTPFCERASEMACWV